MGASIAAGTQNFNILNAVNGLSSSYFGAQQAKAQAGLQASNYRMQQLQNEQSAKNAKLMEQQAEQRGRNASTKGVIERKELREKAADVVGAQQAAQAASGIDNSSGSALDAVANSAYQAAKDEDAMRYNSNLEEWALRMEGRNAATEAASFANMAAMSGMNAKNTLTFGNLAANNTLWGGVLNAAGGYVNAEAQRAIQKDTGESLLNGTILNPKNYRYVRGKDGKMYDANAWWNSNRNNGISLRN